MGLSARHHPQDELTREGNAPIAADKDDDGDAGDNLNVRGKHSFCMASISAALTKMRSLGDEARRHVNEKTVASSRPHPTLHRLFRDENQINAQLRAGLAAAARAAPAPADDRALRNG